MFNPVPICVIINVVFVRHAYLKNSSVFESKNPNIVITSVWKDAAKPLPESLKNGNESSDPKTYISKNAERTNSDINFNKAIMEESPKISQELLDLIFSDNISIAKQEEDKADTEIIHLLSNYIYPKWNHLHDTVQQHIGSKSSTRAIPRHINNFSPKFENESKNSLDSKETNKDKTQHHNISNKNNRDIFHGSFNNKKIYQVSTKNKVVGGSQNKINKTVGVDDRASFGGGCSSGMARVLGECLGED